MTASDLTAARRRTLERIRLSEPPRLDVRGLRLRLKLSQQGLADRLGVTTDTVRAWEHGRRRPSVTAARALRDLGCDWYCEDGKAQSQIAIQAEHAKITSVEETKTGETTMDVEAAARLMSRLSGMRIAPRTVYGWIEKGILPHRRVVGRIILDAAAITNFIERGGSGVPKLYA